MKILYKIFIYDFAFIFVSLFLCVQLFLSISCVVQNCDIFYGVLQK